MIWIVAAGLTCVAAAAILAAARQGVGWWRLLLAGAAGWVAAQVAKGAVILPLAKLAGVGPPLVAVPWWLIGIGALLPGVFEELGKYLPLRWLRVSGRRASLALGLGAGGSEALVLAAGVAVAALTHAPAAHAETLVAALIAIWERLWAVASHAAFATLDGLAVVRRRVEWLFAAMALHTIEDLAPAWYQRARAVHAGAATTHGALVVAEVVVAGVAIAAWLWGRRAWRGQEG